MIHKKLDRISGIESFDLATMGQRYMIKILLLLCNFSTYRSYCVKDNPFFHSVGVISPINESLTPHFFYLKLQAEAFDSDYIALHNKDLKLCWTALTSKTQYKSCNNNLFDENRIDTLNFFNHTYTRYEEYGLLIDDQYNPFNLINTFRPGVKPLP